MSPKIVYLSHTEADSDPSPRAQREKQRRNAEMVDGINQLLVQLGKRPSDPLPCFEECPECGSHQVHTTVNRVKCQACSAILAQRESVPEPDEGASK